VITSGNVTLMVGDFKKMLRFYTETLGARLATRVGDEWAEAEFEGLTIGLHSRTHGAAAGSAAAAGSGNFSIGLQVDAIEDAMKALEAKGIRFRGPPVDDTAVRLAFFGDPEGNALYLCEVVKR
jgi:catechol 2,3-dioxygenase-like lactoylglutathione lyase family enzyme